MEGETLTPDQAHAEMLKCQADPRYFYNTYTNTGRENPISQDNWENVLALIRLYSTRNFKRKKQ